MTQRILVVLSFDIDGSPTDVGEAVSELLKAIDPPSLSHFTGDARVTVEPYSTQVERWLDDGVLPDAEPVVAEQPPSFPGPAHRKPFPPAANRAERRHPHR